MKKCKGNGLPDMVPELIEKAKHLREFSNYGSDIIIEDGHPIFQPCVYTAQGCDSVLNVMDDAIVKTIQWLYKTGAQHDIYAIDSVIHHSRRFFEERDLMYLDWCSRKARASALSFASSLVRPKSGDPGFEAPGPPGRHRPVLAR